MLVVVNVDVCVGTAVVVELAFVVAEEDEEEGAVLFLGMLEMEALLGIALEEAGLETLTEAEDGLELETTVAEDERIAVDRLEAALLAETLG